MGMNIKTPVRVIQVYDGVYHLVDSDGNKLITEQESVIDFEWLAMVINEREELEVQAQNFFDMSQQSSRENEHTRRLLVNSKEKVKDLSLDLFLTKQSLSDLLMIIDSLKAGDSLKPFQDAEIEKAKEVIEGCKNQRNTK